MFGRLAEEVQALEAAGIDYEIVPGITAALAAGSYAGIWLTQRDVASAVALVTGHEGDSEHAPPLDYAALAAFPGTLVFYMGVTTAREWTAALVAAGKSADTSAAIVRRCSWPDQTAIRCTLGTVVEQLEKAHMRPPVVVIVGEAVGLGAGRIMVHTPAAIRQTRADHQADRAGRYAVAAVHRIGRRLPGAAGDRNCAAGRLETGGCGAGAA